MELAPVGCGERLDRKQFAFAARGGYHAIVPGEPAESELYLRVASEFSEAKLNRQVALKILPEAFAGDLIGWRGSSAKPRFLRVSTIPTLQRSTGSRRVMTREQSSK